MDDLKNKQAGQSTAFKNFRSLYFSAAKKLLR